MNLYIKKILLILIATSVSVCGFAQNVLLKGILKPEDNSVFLRLKNDRLSIDVPIKVNADHSFQVTVPHIGRGFYEMDQVGKIYLEPGYVLSIASDNVGCYQFTGQGSEENNILTVVQKAERLLPINSEGSLYYADLNAPPNEFLKKLDHYKAVITQELIPSKNDYFKKIVSEDAESHTRNLISSFASNYGLDSVILHKMELIGTSTYLTDPRDRQKQRLMYIFAAVANWLTDAQKLKLDSLSQLKFEWNNEALYNNSNQYRSELVNNLLEINKKQGGPTDAASPDRYKAGIALTDKTVSNPVIKNYLKAVFGLKYMLFAKKEDQIDSMYHSLSALNVSQSDKEKIERQYRNYKILKNDPGAVNFSYTDVNGKTISLKSLRGKYVYIDIWATWCVPCLMEVPSLKKMEEAYHGKNIQFVSISVDKQKDKGKWQQMVNDRHMSGIQLISDNDFSSSFMQTFQITSIPRFILIDPVGKVISADAFRPSQPDLKAQLDELIAKEKIFHQ